MIHIFKNIMLVAILYASVIGGLTFQPLYAADEKTVSEYISICSRSEPVRVAIQKEVDIQRFIAGSGAPVRCKAIRAAELSAIRYLRLSAKEISRLEPGDFEGLDGLQTLDLEGNHLSELNPSVLSGLKNLQNLILARNPLTSLTQGLTMLNGLKRIDLSGCRISSVAPDVFEGNPNLKAVYLSDNRLQSLPEGVFSKNDLLQIIDLAGNLLMELPASFISKEAALQSLDLSRNRIEKQVGFLASPLSGPMVLNLAQNPVTTATEESSWFRKLNRSVSVFAGQGRWFTRDFEEAVTFGERASDDETVAAEGVRRLCGFVRDHWHMPLEVTASFSTNRRADLTNPGLRAREERMLLHQLEEVREAYRRASFDFFAVKIHFLAPDSTQRAPILSFNKKELGFVIILKAPQEGADIPSLISDDQMLNLLADHFSRNHSIAWFRKEPHQELLAALTRDFEKVDRIDDELRFDIIRLDDLIDTAMERMREAGDRKFFSETELTDARFIQFRVMLNLQRLENTMARWKLAETSAGFAYGPEVRLLLADASGMHRTYLDWFLNTVVGGRSTINVFDETWYHRNPIFKILDSEVPAGFFNVEGRISTRIPGGAIQDMMRSRLGFPLLRYLQGMRSLDRKVSASNIQDSPLSERLRKSAERIKRNHRTFSKNKISDTRIFKEILDSQMKNTVKFPFYRATVSVATLIGDTRVSNPSPAITDEQMKDMRAHLKPGDLLVERTDYYLSNAFLGGFWPHGILYLGPKEEWSKLKLADGSTLAEDPWIAKNILPNYYSQKDNRPAMVIEAISEGVVFNSLEEAAQKDYIGIFRPKFAPAEQEAKVAAAIRRALRYHGRPYDFDFDFFTDDKLVCTELLYRAYHPDINFLVQKQAVRKPDPPVPGMIKKAGRDTMPAGEIVKLVLYMLDHKEPVPSIGYAGQTLEFVRLYMKNAQGGSARIFEGVRGIEALRRTLP